MDHLSSTALELRSGAQERQGQHGYLSLGGKVSRQKDHTAYAILSWVPPFTTQVRLILPDTRKGPAKHDYFPCERPARGSGASSPQPTDFH